MKFAAIIVALSTLFAVTAAAPVDSNMSQGRIMHAPGAKDGIYSHYMGLDGTIRTLYHGMPNVTVSSAVNATSAPSHAKRGSTGVACQSLTFSSDDAQQAIQNLANTFNNQRTCGT